MLLFIDIDSTVEFIKITKIQNRIKRGEKVESNKKYLSTAIKQNIRILLLISVLVVSLVLKFSDTDGDKAYTISDYPHEIPVVTLENLLQGENIKVGWTEYEGVDYGSFVREKRDILVEEWLEISQYCSKEGGRESWSMEAEYYDFVFESISNLAERELVARETGEFGKMDKVEIDGVDKAYLLEKNDENGRTDLILRSGTKVVWVYYEGKINFEEHIDEIVENFVNYV